jgi:transcriptional regulator MraZ
VANTVEHAILYGEHDLNIDEKNRMLIPAEIRKALEAFNDGSTFFVLIGVDRRPWLFPERLYKALISQRQQDLSPSADRLAFDDQHFAMASPVECDKQGRILLPDKLLKRTNTGREVTVTGSGTHLKIWNRADWEARVQSLLNDGRGEAQSTN